VLPSDLARYRPFLARLLAKSRGERFADAAEIVAAATALGAAAGDQGELSAPDAVQPSAA
jgi:hypothetical protein